MEKKTELIGVRLTPRQKQQVDEICNAEGTDSAEWIRGLIREAIHAYIRRPGRPRLKSLRGEEE